VVVTEDEALLREMIVRMLRLEGYLVFEFGTAEATIETVDRHLRGVDLLISDIHLPQKDGLCLFDTLRQSYPELRAVFVSGTAHSNFRKAHRFCQSHLTGNGCYQR
jgi:two-component system response regulator GlrR